MIFRRIFLRLPVRVPLLALNCFRSTFLRRVLRRFAHPRGFFHHAQRTILLRLILRLRNGLCGLDRCSRELPRRVARPVKVSRKQIRLPRFAFQIGLGGNTREHKDRLKSLGCRWSNNKKLWYWHHPEEGVKWRKRKTTMSEIRSKYGSETISSNRNTRLEAAV